MSALLHPAQPDGVAWPTKAWPRGTATGLDADRLAELVETAFSPASQADMGESHAFLAIQHGQIVAEHYAGGDYTAGATYPSWSMAKSITQLLIGFLVAEGRIDPNAPIPVPEWQDADDPRRTLTWTHLLQMASGLEFVEDYVDGTVSDVIEMLFVAGRDDVAGYAARKPLAHEPGTVFNYASGTSNILARALGELIGDGKAGMLDFMDARLFGPLGVAPAVPKFDASETFVGSSYCFLRAEDFAKFGLLALRGGVWDGQQILPQGWIDFALTPGPAQPDERWGYGAHWWLNMFCEGGFSMNGYAGQWVACCPKRDLILVRHGNSVNEANALRQDKARDWLIDAMACFTE